MASPHIPQDVLSQKVAEQLGGRRIRTAVFTTYTFDPGFFEDHILPVLFETPFSQEEKVRRIQMEDTLRTVDDIAVYYDKTALLQTAKPAQLDYRRIDVRRTTGAFHPKLILLLVENESDERDGAPDPHNMSLIVATLSANLTQSGWWENVETGHIEEIDDRTYDDSRTSYRTDVISLFNRLKRCCAPDEDHSALEQIHDFLVRRTNTDSLEKTTNRGQYYTRLFCGQKSLPDWLSDLGIHRRCTNLEIISPYFDRSPASTLGKLIEAVEPDRVRVYLPRNADGSAAVTAETFEAISTMDNVKWATLPGEVLLPGGRKGTKNAAPRRVHAKVYRFWAEGGPDVTLSGSVNLTSAGHTHSNAGNFEAAFLSDITDISTRRWWLDPITKEPKFTEKQADEDDESQDIPIDITFKYEWIEGALTYRFDGNAGEDVTVCEPGGVKLFDITHLAKGDWISCGEDSTARVRELLQSTSFLEIHHKKGQWRVLVREEGMRQRPSLLASLTPEEILMYWSLLSPAQKEYFITEKLDRDSSLPGTAPRKSSRYDADDTVFDRFAGVYHAFEQLADHVDNALESGNNRQAEARLFGAKYDSLPQLLEKTVEREDGDAVMAYVTFLSAKQIVARITKAHPDFIKAHKQEAQQLSRLLKKLAVVRKRLEFQDKDNSEFLAWYEQMFLVEIEQPEVEEEN